MSAFAIVVAVIVVVALLCIAWAWFTTGIPSDIAALSRIAFEEQLALWRIETIRHDAQEKMRKMREEHRPHTWDDR